MQLNIVRASINDIDLLVETRIATLRAANLLENSVDMSLVEVQSKRYYEQCLGKDHIAYLAYDYDKVVACGGVSFFQVMPTYCNPRGKKAYVMNMFTHPDYRRRGIAAKVLDLLIDEAKQRDILEITLEATEEGKALYEKYGFICLKDEMILPQ